MGNVQSEVTAGVKKQADADASQIKCYELCDLAKRGTLVDVMTEAMRTKNYEGVNVCLRDNHMMIVR